ncbi:MAG: hypothetical protein GXO71_02795 [Caldiserica bacterium]|nr:hypothetical protein [Caldisericota bacterium]
MIYKNAELYNVTELLSPEDSGAPWTGVHGSSFDSMQQGKIICRIPDNLRVTLNEDAKKMALTPGGCEIRFNVEKGSAKVVLRTVEKVPAILEVFQGNFQISWHCVYTEPTEIIVSHPDNMESLCCLTKKFDLPFDPYLTRVILPYKFPIELLDIQGDISPPRKNQSPGKKYLAYGSSITHGSLAMRPTGSYVMRIAQMLGVDLINLGFGGGAYCEKQMADYIAERCDWDFATLEIGINMLAAGFEVKEFRKTVEYFIRKIAESHPDKWVFCIDLFLCRWDFDSSSTKQDKFREIVRNIVENLNMPKLIHIDGKEILGKVSQLTSDLVHPSPSGMEEIALNLSKVIRKYLRATKQL